MKHLMINSPDDIHLHLKRLMYARNVNAQKLSKEAGIPYSRLIRTLRNEREFTASEMVLLPCTWALKTSINSF